MKKLKLILFAAVVVRFATAFAETPAPPIGKTNIFDSTGGQIGSTLVGTYRGINIHLIDSSLPITALSLPLPTGASTETSLLGVRTDLSSILAKMPTLVSGAVPVSGTVGVSGTVSVVGSFFQATQPVSIAATVPVSGSLGRSWNLSSSGDSVNISNFPSSQAVTIASLPLASGAATSANQSTANSSLSSIDGKLSSTAGALNVNVVSGGGSSGSGLTDTQLRASAVPVSLSSAPLAAGASTSSLQTSGNSSLSSIDGKLSSTSGSLNVNITGGGSSAGLTDTQLRATAVPVSISNFPATQPVSGTVAISGTVPVSGPLTDTQLRASTLPVSGTVAVSNQPTTLAVTQATGTNLHTVVDSGAVTATISGTPNVAVTSSALSTGASTSALQTSGNTALTSIDAKTPAIEYMSSGTITGTGNVAGTNITTNGKNTVSVYIDGTWSGLVGIQGRVAGTSAWSFIPLFDYGTRTSQIYIGSPGSVATANVGGFQEIRLSAPVWSSGTGYPFLGMNSGTSPSLVTSSSPGGFYTTTNLRDGTSNAITSTSGALDVNIKSGGGSGGSSGPVSDVSATGTLGALNDAVAVATQGAGTVVVEVVGTFTGTFTFEASNNGFTTAQPVAGVYLGGLAGQSSSFSAAGHYSVLAAGYKQLRVRMSAYSSGSASALLNSSVGDRISVALQGNPVNLQTLASQGPAGTSAWKVDGSAVTQPVSGSLSVSNFPATQPVSGTVLVSNLPALGQATPANSQPVVQASNVLVTGPSAQGTSSVDILTGTVNGWTDASNYRSVAYQIVGGAAISSGGIVFEQTNDATSNAGQSLYLKEAGVLGGAPITQATIAANTNRMFEGQVNSKYIRARIFPAFTGGTASATALFSQSPYAAQQLTVNQATAASLNTTSVVSGTLTSVGTVTTVSAITSAGLASAVVTDISSAALAATATSAAVATTNTQSAAFQVTVTAVSGTNPTLDVVVQESKDGTNWKDIYHFERITATGFYESPSMRLEGAQIRYVRTVAGTTPSFTNSVIRTTRQTSAPLFRRLFDRAITPNTVNATSAVLGTEGCDELQIIQASGAGATTSPIFTLEGSETGISTEYYSIMNSGSAVTLTGSAGSTSASFTGALPKFARARVSTAGIGATINYVALKCRSGS